MNTLINFNQNKQASMNSMDMALLVKKRHDNVKRTVETLVNKGVIVQPHNEDVHSTDTIGRTRITQVYKFSGDQGKRDCLVVVAQLSPEFTGAVVDRWLELERQIKEPQVPTNYLEALEHLIAKEKQLIEAQPKIQHYDLIVDKANLLNATQVAQKLGMTAQRLNRKLEQVEVYDHRIKRGRTFSSWFIQEGYGEMKQTSNGFSQALFTLRGEAWIVSLLGSEA